MPRELKLAWVGPFKLKKKKPKALFNLINTFGFKPQEIMIKLVDNNKFELGAVVEVKEPIIHLPGK